jgi:hypothetical protein
MLDQDLLILSPLGISIAFAKLIIQPKHQTIPTSNKMTLTHGQIGAIVASFAGAVIIIACVILIVNKKPKCFTISRPVSHPTDVPPRNHDIEAQSPKAKTQVKKPSILSRIFHRPKVSPNPITRNIQTAPPKVSQPSNQPPSDQPPLAMTEAEESLAAIDDERNSLRDLSIALLMRKQQREETRRAKARDAQLRKQEREMQESARAREQCGKAAAVRGQIGTDMLQRASVGEDKNFIEECERKDSIEGKEVFVVGDDVSLSSEEEKEREVDVVVDAMAFPVSSGRAMAKLYGPK